MKKFISNNKKSIAITAAIIVMVVCLLLTFVGCNKQLIDTNQKFDYAYLSFGDGTVKKVEIKSWTDFEDGDQIQITAKDGTVYLAHSLNCILVKEGK